MKQKHPDMSRSDTARKFERFLGIAPAGTLTEEDKDRYFPRGPRPRILQGLPESPGPISINPNDYDVIGTFVYDFDKQTEEYIPNEEFRKSKE